MKHSTFAAMLLPLLLVTLAGFVPQDAKPAAVPPAAQEVAKPADDAAVVDAQLPSYPLGTCPISNEELGEEAVNVVTAGRLVRLCCGMCAKKLAADSSAVIAKIDAAVIAAQKPDYPLKKCLVSDEPLGEDAVDVVYGTRLVRLCCKNCRKGFDKDPARIMAQIDAALIAQQLPGYPLKTCLVSGEEFGSGGMQTFDMLYGTRLVRLCCKSCVREFKKEPDQMLAKIDAAMAARKANPVDKQ
jgi:type II secretory ATPase GspE/PulE/Tfp pilus assembly ATPase PilB-like protein